MPDGSTNATVVGAIEPKKKERRRTLFPFSFLFFHRRWSNFHYRSSCSGEGGRTPEVKRKKKGNDEALPAKQQKRRRRRSSCPRNGRRGKKAGTRFNYLIFPPGAPPCASGGVGWVHYRHSSKTMITHKKFSCSRQLPNGRVLGDGGESVPCGQLDCEKKVEMDKMEMKMRYNFWLCLARPAAFSILSFFSSPFSSPYLSPSLIFSMAFLAAFFVLEHHKKSLVAKGVAQHRWQTDEKKTPNPTGLVSTTLTIHLFFLFWHPKKAVFLLLSLSLSFPSLSLPQKYPTVGRRRRRGRGSRDDISVSPRQNKNPRKEFFSLQANPPVHWLPPDQKPGGKSPRYKIPKNSTANGRPDPSREKPFLESDSVSNETAHPMQPRVIPLPPLSLSIGWGPGLFLGRALGSLEEREEREEEKRMKRRRKRVRSFFFSASLWYARRRRRRRRIQCQSQREESLI